MKDRIGRDRDTGVRGVELGVRVVKNGEVRILGYVFRCPALDAWEGKAVEVSVRDAHGTQYSIRNPDTLDSIGVAAMVR